LTDIAARFDEILSVFF